MLPIACTEKEKNYSLHLTMGRDYSTAVFRLAVTKTFGV
jgi:hypothetical protein